MAFPFKGFLMFYLWGCSFTVEIEVLRLENKISVNCFELSLFLGDDWVIAAMHRSWNAFEQTQAEHIQQALDWWLNHYRPKPCNVPQCWNVTVPEMWAVTPRGAAETSQGRHGILARNLLPCIAYSLNEEARPMAHGSCQLKKVWQSFQ